MPDRPANRRVPAVLGAMGLVAVAAVFATCSGDVDTPPEVPAARETSLPEAEAPAPPRMPRRPRAVVAAERNAEKEPARPAWLERGEEAAGYGWVYEPPALPPTPPPGRGRVKVLMRKDGSPFNGAHVCFYPADEYVDARPWDGARWSGSPHATWPLYTRFWPDFDPVLGSADGAQEAEERTRGVTEADGTLTIDVRAGVSLVPYVRYEMGGIPLVSQPRVNVADGGETELTIDAAPRRTLPGRCIDEAGRGLAGIWVQAIAQGEERPLSRRVETAADGSFVLEVWGADPEVSVRAVVPYVARPLGIYESESDIPPIPAETTVPGVVPGDVPSDRPVIVRMAAARVVIVELTSGAGEAPANLDVAGLVWDPGASAWGRLGGPRYARVAGSSPHPTRGFAALPVADAARPLLLWSQGLTITAVDPRGADRLAVTIPRGRRATLRGRGWRETDRLRVVSWVGARGEEFPCIWMDVPVGKTDRWERDDAPAGAIEFQIVRDGAVIGWTRVAEGTGPAPDVSLDVD